jgi:hypothetical protein
MDMKTKTSTFLALTAVLITAVLVWLIQRPAAPRQAAWEDVVAEARAGGYALISTEALAVLHAGKPSDLLLVDTRQDWEYRTGHIDGALNFSMEPTWWARLTKADELAAFLGPDKDRTLVFY